MSNLGATAGEGSLHSALGRWRQHIDFVISNPSALGIVQGAVDRLRAAGGEIQLSSKYGQWAHRLSVACDNGDFASVLELLSASRGERGRSATYGWDLMQTGEVLPPPQPFPELPGEIFRFQIGSTTNTGEGTPITAAQDMSGSGNVIMAGAAGQEWTYSSTRYGTGWSAAAPGRAGALSSDGWMTCGPGSPIVNFLNGKPAGSTQLSIVINFQQRVHITSTWVSWYNSALFSRHLSLRTVTSTYVPQIIGGTSLGAQTSISAPGTNVLFDRWHPCPMLYIYRTDGALDYHRIDGHDDTPVARAWGGTYSCDTFAMGAGSTGAAFTRLNNAIYAELIIYGHLLTTAECQALETYTGTNYAVQSFKANLGATRPTRVYGFPGQSNNSGGCPSSPNYGSATPFIYMIGLDGLYKPLTEPSHDITNQVTAPLNWAAGVIGPSKALQFCIQSRVAGLTRDQIVVTGALPGSTADSWSQNVTIAPNMLNLSGFMKMRTNEALKAPSADLIWLVDQGEADCDSNAETVNWPVQWTIWKTEMDTFYAGYYAKTAHIFLSYISNPIAGVGAFSTQLRNAQIAWAAANNPSVIGYQRPQGSCEAPVGLHLINSEQQDNGVIEANLVAASA